MSGELLEVPARQVEVPGLGGKVEELLQRQGQAGRVLKARGGRQGRHHDSTTHVQHFGIKQKSFFKNKSLINFYYYNSIPSLSCFVLRISFTTFRQTATRNFFLFILSLLKYDDDDIPSLIYFDLKLLLQIAFSTFSICFFHII